MSGDSALFTLDPQTGIVQFVTWFPSGTTASGDLAFVGGRLLATGKAASGDNLVEFDLKNNTTKVVGAVGYSCTAGLAAYGATL